MRQGLKVEGFNRRLGIIGPDRVGTSFRQLLGTVGLDKVGVRS